MKKSLIALAVAAALPVAAQAGTTISGSVEAEYTLGSNLAPALDTALSIASTEVLTNGMTATAKMNMFAEADVDGTISLSGDFGTVTAGSAASSATASDADDTSENILGVAYSGTMAGLAVNAAMGTWDHDSDAAVATAVQDYVTYGATYDFNGLAVAASSTNKTTGGTAVTTVSGSYAFGDLTVTAAKDSDDANAVLTAAYATTMDALAVSISATSADAWDVSATYTLGGIAITATDDEAAGGADLSASYTSGAMTLTVDSDSDIDVAYDMGNADLAISRDSDADA
ncbi:MAG: hypothetical protein GY905_01895, partial [Gammaproteobacteria bacterium]|nr:hypothetical protein [Gammaproteobacteria bacterium]